MKIDKISLYNFNSFEGLNEFDFSISESDKNIILIGGKNGAGKTSLFTAIKIALYGPLAFGYVGNNPHYVAKIKECINTNAFQMNRVEAWVKIRISLTVEREIRDYEITREWDYSQQKLLENFYVKSGGELLDEQEQSYFQNYLQSLIPPDLFEFFLFDGEEVGNIFSTSSYNSYIKNAVYTLCGLDIYEIIRKYTRGYAGKASTEDEEKLLEEYEQLREEQEEAEREEESLSAGLDQTKMEWDQVQTELVELETAFKNAGGLAREKREEMMREYDAAERRKNEAAAEIKMFVEGMMPFYIVREFAGKISDQLDSEEEGAMFAAIKQNIKREDIREVLGDAVSDETVDALVNMLFSKFQPVDGDSESEIIHDLSREDSGRVRAMVAALKDFDTAAMVRAVERKQQASDQTMEINKVLKNAMTDEDAAEFAERESRLLRKREEIGEKIRETATALEQMQQRLKDLTAAADHAWQHIKDNAKDAHVFELSSDLSGMMDVFLKGKTEKIKRDLERLIVENLQCIYRKNNLITHIEIDDAFQFHLYQNAMYTERELSHLMQNLGKDGFAETIGREGRKILFERYQVDTLRGLQKALAAESDEEIPLFKKIDLGRLSKGERQIFILSLYWAIIKLSGQDIPFIIDTPYARIDANHRKEISEKFFPNISRQVIILSTDEEINEEYYDILKPYISKEYLLINDESQNRTSVEHHYFF